MSRLSDISYYQTGKDIVPKSKYVSTENMLQNFAGMEPYKDEAIVSGIPFASGDVLIANIRPYLKKIWKANFAGCCNTDVLVLHSANINPDYLYYNIAREDFITHVMSGVKGSKMPRGDKTQILEYKVGVPTHKEQQKIASILSLLDNRIVKQRQLIEALKSYKRGLLKHIFDDHYGSGWHEVSLGEISQITMGQSPDSASYNIDQIGLPLVQGNADITDGITTPQRYTSAPTKICDAGSIILSVRAPVGSVSWANQRLCLGRGVCAITAQNTKFLYQLLIHHQDDWKRIEQGGTFTAISGDDISSFKVSVPNKDTQSTISFFLSKYDAMEQREENVLRVLQRQKAALLQQLFI